MPRSGALYLIQKFTAKQTLVVVFVLLILVVARSVLRNHVEKFVQSSVHKRMTLVLTRLVLVLILVPPVVIVLQKKTMNWLSRTQPRKYSLIYQLAIIKNLKVSHPHVIRVNITHSVTPVSVLPQIRQKPLTHLLHLRHHRHLRLRQKAWN
jgi:hypothetical protein